MDAAILLKGLILGFSIAAPVGPIGIICIRRTISDGKLAGFLAGLGAASADAIYGSIAGFGITFVSNFLVSQQYIIRTLGGFFLIFLGIKTFMANPSPALNLDQQRTKSSIYFTTFFLTLTNPMTILSFAAIFSGLGIMDSQVNYSSAVLLVLGVFLGSTVWWVLLSTITGGIRTKLNFESLKWINRVSGLIILCFGIFALTHLIS